MRRNRGPKSIRRIALRLLRPAILRNQFFDEMKSTRIGVVDLEFTIVREVDHYIPANLIYRTDVADAVCAVTQWPAVYLDRTPGKRGAETQIVGNESECKDSDGCW